MWSLEETASDRVLALRFLGNWTPSKPSGSSAFHANKEYFTKPGRKSCTRKVRTTLRNVPSRRYLIYFWKIGVRRMKVGKEKKSRKKCSYPRKNKTVPALCVVLHYFTLLKLKASFLGGREQQTQDHSSWGCVLAHLRRATRAGSLPACFPPGQVKSFLNPNMVVVSSYTEMSKQNHPSPDHSFLSHQAKIWDFKVPVPPST